ncbi:PIN domain-containing protein [Candidatus Woesearchaeota archaeon]|nr:PIN domain-containing protein [Candidatus Woesearchaeota archaeon]
MKFDCVLDTFAWVEYFQASKKGEKVKELIENKKVATPIIVIAELADSYFRIGEELGERYNFIISNSTIIDLTSELCIDGARIKNNMRKTEKDFGLIDGIIYAISKKLNARLVTGDPHLKNMNNIVFL